MLFLQNTKLSRMFLVECSNYGAPAVQKCQLTPCFSCSMPSCRVECWSWSKRTSSGCCTRPLRTEPLAWGACGTEMCTLINNKNNLLSFSFAFAFNYRKFWHFTAWAKKKFFPPQETQVDFIYNTMQLCLTWLKTDPLYSTSHQFFFFLNWKEKFNPQNETYYENGLVLIKLSFPPYSQT